MREKVWRRHRIRDGGLGPRHAFDDGLALGTAVTEHAHTRHRDRVPRHVPRRYEYE